MAYDRIMVLDDEPIITKSLQALLQRQKRSVVCAATLAEAEKVLQRDNFDLVFMDVRLPDGESTGLLERVCRQPEAPTVVMMTGYASIESAIECMRAGAFDYMIKPFGNNQIEMVLKKAENYRKALTVARYYSQESGRESMPLLGASPAMNALRALLQRVARTDATVLVQGESGCGKELVAAAVHQASQRSAAPFIKVNCAAIAPTLIESEFFGHEKGAFTGATGRREGRFELADGGTILLDEVSEIPPPLQAKLLRVLQEREFQRVGGTATLKIDVRVVATTNRKLQSAVERGEFREDLYYRLNVVPVTVPPLRDRIEDIPLLANAFLERFARQHGNHPNGFTPDALAALTAHNWPGNVRELQNTIERAVILAEPGEPITAVHCGFAASTAPTGSPPSHFPAANSFETGMRPMADVERDHILHVLKACNANRTKAADILGISLRGLRDKLRFYRESGFFVPEN